MQKEDSVDNETHFHNSLQGLRDFSSQLYHTAEYCEATFLAAEDKTIIMEDTKRYVSWAVVEAVQHLGSISANLQSSLSNSSSIYPQTNRKIDFLEMRIVECQQQQQRRSHQLPLHRFYLTPDLSRHHCRYILPRSTDPAPLDEEFETEEPLPVRGDGVSVLPKSEQSAVFKFKGGQKLQRSAMKWKGVHSRDMGAWLIRRTKRILA